MSLDICMHMYLCIYIFAYTCAIIIDYHYFEKFLYGQMLLNGGFTASYENVGRWFGL